MPTGSKPGDGTAAGSSAPPSAGANTLYDTLGITQSATTEEVTVAYRKLALLYHPDRPDGSKDKFQEVQRAYEVLHNPANRSQYDALLKGKPVLKNFRRPAKLEKVEKPVHALLADLAFYEFEGAPSKLRCSVHFGDGIEFNNERGSFIGLAADGYLYWTVNGRGYATQLCRADSDMALSNVHVAYRSNMGLRRKPLERSRAGNIPPTAQPHPTSQQRPATRPSVGSPHSGTSAHLAQTTGGAPRLSEAERLRRNLVNKERHRSATKRLETIEREETDERDDLERVFWEKFCMLHTNLEAGMRCVTRGLPVATEMALFMGYMSPEEVPLASSVPVSLHPSGTHESPQVASLWVDPLECDVDDDKEGEAVPDEGSDGAAEGNARAGKGFQSQEWPPSRSASSSTFSSPPSQSDSAAATASDGDSCRARPTALPQALHRTGCTAAYVSPQPSGSSPMVRGPVHGPMHLAVSTSSSLGNIQQSPAQPSHLRTVSSASSPGGCALPTTKVGAHGLAAEPRATHAPQALHSSPQGSTTVQFASGAPRVAATTSAARDTDGLFRVGSGQDSLRVSRASCHESHHPSPLQSLTTPPANGILHLHEPASPPEANESSAERFVSLLQATHDYPEHGGGTSATASATRAAADKEGLAIPARPLYPWSVEHSSQRNSQARVAHVEVLPDPSARCSSASPAATAPQDAPLRESVANSAGQDAPGDSPPLSSSPSPQPAREKTSTFSYSPAHTPAAALTAAGSIAQGDFLKAVAHHGHVRNGEEPRILKLRPTTSAAACTAEADASISPRPVAPSKSLETLHTPRVVAPNGRSTAADAFSRGESGDGCVSCSLPSVAAADRSRDEVLPRLSTQSLLCVPGASAVSHDTPSSHPADTVESSVLPPPSDSENGPLETAAREDAGLGAKASSGGGRGDAAAVVSATAGDAAAPRVAMASLRLALPQDYTLQRTDQENELDPPPLSPNTMALERRKRSKGRVTPRYMMPTQAHARRASGVPSESCGVGGQTQSPRLENAQAYNSMSVAEMLAEEEEFMKTFSKTKRVT